MGSLANFFWRGVRAGVLTWIARTGVFVVLTGIALLFPHMTGPGGRFQDAVLVVFFPLVFPLHLAAMYVMRALVILDAGNVKSVKVRPINTLYTPKLIPWTRRRWIYGCYVVAAFSWGWSLTDRSAHSSNFTLFTLSVILAFYVNGYQVFETHRELQQRRHD